MAGDRASDLVIDALAVMRLTRLVTSDRLTRPARRKTIRAFYGMHDRPLPAGWDEFGPAVVTDDPDAPELAYLASCDWCASMWVAIAVLIVRSTIPGVWRPLARVLAASQTAGMAASAV